MIKYNYNQAYIATWEELEPLYDAGDSIYHISDNPEINKRFLSIPKLFEKGICPFITLRSFINDTTIFSIQYAVLCDISYQDDGTEMINVMFADYMNRSWVYDGGVLVISD